MTPTPTQADGNQRDSGQLLSVGTVAKHCGVSVRTVYRWLNDGLVCHRLSGAGARPILRVDSGDLDQWLGRFRHDFAEERASNRTLRLAGRRFIKAATSSGRPCNRLDKAATPPSRGRPERSRR